jgi:hypothetical protein
MESTLLIMLRLLLLMLQSLANFAAAVPPHTTNSLSGSHANSDLSPGWQFLESYPRQYIVHRLQPGERIDIDGQLDDDAWSTVNWTEPMEDIAQSLYPGLSIPDSYATLMKVRYDADFLYIGAKYFQSFTWATLTGHNDKLTGGFAPYSNDDFEVFLDPSGTTHGYVEYEMNARNATYDILWREPFGPDGPERGNSSWYSRFGVSDVLRTKLPKPGWATREMTWTMGPPGTPGGLRTATDLSYALGGMDDGSGGGYIDPLSPPPPERPYWTLELAFPLRSSSANDQPHGGLLDGSRGGAINSSNLDPNHGAKYWWANFARTQHPVETVAPEPNLIGARYFRTGAHLPPPLADNGDFEVEDKVANPYVAAMCEQLQAKWPSLLGAEAGGCSWEWVWQQLGITRSMHNPEFWGLLQFESGAPGTAPLCRNVEWPVRYALTQVYRAEREMMRLYGRYTSELLQLLDPELCNMVNHTSSCEMHDLALVLGEYKAIFNISVLVDHSERCSDPNIEHGYRYTGAACFVATSYYQQPGTGYRIVGRIDESRYTTMERHYGGVEKTQTGLECL